ncbi:MAG: ABC transporter ATP-binding protein [Bacteroidales bacterium]|nr:ABC transporter ATP-binding protein [Bacteroidales bacterium]
MKLRTSSFTLRQMRPYGARFALYLVLVVMSVLFTMATALSVADFLKILFDTGDAVPTPTGNLVVQWLNLLYAWLITFGKLKALLLFSLLLFVLYSCKNLFSYLSTIEISIIRCGVIRDLRDKMFRRAMRLPMSYYDRQRKGDVMARFSSDMVEYEEGVMGSLQTLISSVISMALFLFMLFYINVKLSLFVLVMLPVVAGGISVLAHNLKRASKRVQEMNSYLIDLTDETIGGLKVIKSYVAIDFSNRRFRDYNHQYTRKRRRIMSRIVAASPLSDFLSNVVVIGVLMVGAALVFAGDNGLTADLFISYVMLFVLMIPPAKDIASSFSKIKKGQACADRIEAFLSEEEEATTCAGIVSSNAMGEVPKEGIHFRHITFAYKPGIEVLKDITFDVPRGTTVALVGSSGSGKSTIADLLCRFYTPQSGAIVMEGRNINDIPLADLRSRIGVVAQDTLLFNDSVAANIAFGRPDATHDEVVAAARAAQAHDFIMQLPHGYDTNLGEGGSLLSGGQRQRISIARALLREPDLLILDEATSALDTESERLVQATLNEVLVGRTALVIAHRLSTVVGADNIIVLDGGRIVEQGTHSELMALGGRYSELVALQTL